MTDELLAHAAAASDRVDLWRRILIGHGVNRMAEVGVWRGDFAAAMLRDCPEISTYYLIDPWRPLEGWNKPLNVSADRFVEAHRDATAAVAFAGPRVVVLRGTTREVADRIPDGSLDAVYVDGDHTLRGITVDLIRMLPKLRPDGLLGGDDFFPDPWHHGAAYEPTLVSPFAVHFAEALELPVVALPFHQFVIRNRPGAFSFTNISGVKHSCTVGLPMQPRKQATGGSTGRLPDFIVVGATKAGTTSLDFYLSLHPEIHMARPKEPRFFVDAPPPGGRWSLGADWYRRLFVTDKRWCGETTPRYTHAPSVEGVAERMASVIPEAKLIYLVREPMARLRSNYLMNVKRGDFSGSFADYVEQCGAAVDASCYGRQLSEYLRHYPLDRILVVETAELHADRLGALRRIFRFIGARDSFSTPLFFHRRNVGRMECFPSRLGRRLVNSAPMRFLERTLPGGAYYHLRNLVLAPFSVPAPSTELPEGKERELDSLFRNEVATLRKLTGLALPSLEKA